MQTFWDLSEKERAELNREGVEKFIDAELMTKGVLRVKPLEEDPEVDVPEPTGLFYRVRVDTYNYLDVAFRSAEHAQRFLDLEPTEVKNEYVGGESVSHVVAISKPEIVAARMLTRAELQRYRGELERVGETRKANAKRKTEHDEAMRAQEGVLAGLWEEWHRCREKHAEYARILQTLDEYLVIAGGNGRIAVRYLMKVFQQSQIADAGAWFGRTVDLYDRDAEVAPSDG